MFHKWFLSIVNIDDAFFVSYGVDFHSVSTVDARRTTRDVDDVNDVNDVNEDVNDVYDDAKIRTQNDLSFLDSSTLIYTSHLSLFS